LSGTDKVSADVVVGGQYTIHDAVEGLRACGQCCCCSKHMTVLCCGLVFSFLLGLSFLCFVLPDRLLFVMCQI
jgi:hypothetical protein